MLEPQGTAKDSGLMGSLAQWGKVAPILWSSNVLGHYSMFSCVSFHSWQLVVQVSEDLGVGNGDC